MTERRGTRDVPPRRRPERPDSGEGSERPRPFPELSRHLRNTGEVYSPDHEKWLKQPSRRKADPSEEPRGARNGETPKVPPRNRRKKRKQRGPGSAVKVGGVLFACLVLAGFGIERLRVDSGGRTATATPTVLVVADASPESTATNLPSPTRTPTRTATPTETPTETPTPTETSTPSPTATPDPRFIGKVICLDPGHGGSDRGAIRPGNDAAPRMEEGIYNLLWARALKLRLESHGFTVVMTRTEDEEVNAKGRDVNKDGETGKNVADPELAERAKMTDELQARINICNKANASLLISMHINNFADKKASGYETWYSGVRNDADASKLFAEIVVEEIGKQYAEAGYTPRSRGANDDSNAQADPGHGGFEHYLMIGPAQRGKVEPSEMPGAIVEVGFISNDTDAAFMISNAGRNAIVTAYEQAIITYFVTVSEEFVYGAK